MNGSIRYSPQIRVDQFDRTQHNRQLLSSKVMEGQNAIAPIFKWVPDEDDPKTNNKIVLTHIAFKGIFSKGCGSWSV